MSVNKPAIICLLGFLISVTAPAAPAQSTAPAQDQTYKQNTERQTTERRTTGMSETQQSQTGKQSSSVSRNKVRETQMALMRAGLDPGPIDGVMRPKTMAALRNYQSLVGLEVTGTLTAETENSLISGTATERSTPEFGSSQNQNSNGNVSEMRDVQHIQQALGDMGYFAGDVNGMISSDTMQAIRAFQWWNNLSVTGTLDEHTAAAVESQWSGAFQNAALSQNYSKSTLSAVRQKPEPRTTSASDYDHRASKAADVLLDLTKAADKKIPNELLERAEAIAVIPNMIKGAFGIGGRYGKGLIAQRLDNGHWSPAAFIEVGGGSFGAQLGVSATDLVLVFTDKKALGLLEGGKDLKLGVDASIVAGPIGRSAEAGVNLNLESAIYAYSRARGLFAGVALDGAVLDIDDSANGKVHGLSVSAKEILEGKVAAPSIVRPFMDALEKVVPKKRISQK